MHSVLARLRAEYRSRRVAWLAVALVAGIGAGVVIGLVAGARRTERAYPRLLEARNASDVLVAGKNSFGLVGSVDLDEVEKLPEVAETTRVVASLVFTGRTNDGRRIGPADVFPVAAEDTRLGRTIETWKILEGRRADPTKIDEATASFVLAERLDIAVGDTIRLHFVKAESFGIIASQLLSQLGARLAGEPGSEVTRIDQIADGPEVEFRVVGIEAAPDEFPPIPPDVAPPLHLTPAFSEMYGSQIVANPLSYVRLHRPSDLASFAQGVERLAPGEPVGFITSRASLTPRVQRSVGIVANALRLLATLTFLALVFVLGQTVLRQAQFASRDDPTLRALGMTRTEIVSIGIARGAIMGVLAAFVAVVVGVLVSPLMPIGIARTAELDPGISFDGIVLGVGFLATMGLVAGLTFLAAWRVTSPRVVAARRRARRTRTFTGSRTPPTASVGLHFALDPGEPAGGSGASTAIIGVALSIALLAGVWGFRTSLQQLINTPHLYGWNWDAKAGAPALPDIGEVLVPALSEFPAVSALAAGTISQVEIRGKRVDVLAIDDVIGQLAPTVLEGRLPRTQSEILVGRNTIALANAKIGDHIGVEVANTTARVRVVGVGVFPTYGDAGQLGDGALMTYQGLQRVLPEAKQNVFLIRFRRNVDPVAEFNALRRELEPVPTRSSGRPRDLEDLAEVESLPAILGGIVALLAAATLAHTLITSVRRRQREIAVLKTLGFRRRQIALAVVWQTTTLVAVALLIGLPLGLLLGRLAWNVFAENLGTVATSAVPVVTTFVAIPVTLAFANIVAAVPAWLAGRTRPAAALRAE